MEAVAKQLLRSTDVRVQEAFPHARPPSQPSADGQWPDWRTIWREGAHVDVQIPASQFNATPRPD